MFKLNIVLPAAGLGLALNLPFAEKAIADAAYSNNVALSYAISVLASTNPALTDTSGLSVLGSYQLLGDNANNYALVSGDGYYQTASPNATSTAVSNSFQIEFNTSGGASNGSVDTLQTALFGLNFSNASSYSYQLQVTLNYNLQATASGEYASSNILFDYWDSAGLTSGSDYAAATAFSGVTNQQQQLLNQAIWTFTLLPNTALNLSAQSGIESHALASASAAVPLPGSFWLFSGGLFGLCSIELRKRFSASQLLS